MNLLGDRFDITLIVFRARKVIFSITASTLADFLVKSADHIRLEQRKSQLLLTDHETVSFEAVTKGKSESASDNYLIKIQQRKRLQE